MQSLKNFYKRRCNVKLFIAGNGPEKDKLQAVMQARYYSELIQYNNATFEDFYNNALDKCKEYLEIVEQ